MTSFAEEEGPVQPMEEKEPFHDPGVSCTSCKIATAYTAAVDRFSPYIGLCGSVRCKYVY